MTTTKAQKPCGLCDGETVCRDRGRVPVHCPACGPTHPRPIMTRAELAAHQVATFERSHLSDDGYDDMEIANRRGWRELANWGRDGWDLGSWPYSIIMVRTRPGAYELCQISEGDHTVYRFDSVQDRDAAINYLFLWYLAGEDFAPLTWEDRPALDAGELTVEDKWRGPFTWDRMQRDAAAQ